MTLTGVEDFSGSGLLRETTAWWGRGGASGQRGRTAPAWQNDGILPFLNKITRSYKSLHLFRHTGFDVTIVFGRFLN